MLVFEILERDLKPSTTSGYVDIGQKKSYVGCCVGVDLAAWGAAGPGQMQAIPSTFCLQCALCTTSLPDWLNYYFQLS